MEVLTSSKITRTLYLKIASGLLRKRFESVLDTKLYFQLEPHLPESHQISFAIGVSACKAVEKHIKVL